MKLHSIAAKNFMSLRSFEMTGLDAHVNYIVGPNGSGKTTIFRALRALRDAFQVVNSFGGANAAYESFLRDLRRRAYQGQEEAAPIDEIAISIEVTFDTEREVNLLTTFLAAALSNKEPLERAVAQEHINRSISDEGLATFSSSLLDAFKQGDREWLWQGTLGMRCSLNVYDPRLVVGYTCNCAGQPVTFSAGWRPSFDGGHVSSGQLELSQLFGRQTGDATIRGLREAGAEFWSNLLDVLTGAQPAPLTTALDVQAFFHTIATEGETLVAQGVNQHPYPPAHQQWIELAGVPLHNNYGNYVSVAAVFWRVLQEALVFTENVRSPLASERTYAWDQLVNASPEIGNENELPIYLFWLKNGDSRARERYRQIQDTFQKLVGSERSFEVIAARPSVPSASATQRRELNATDSAAEVTLDLMYLGHQGRELPLADQGAGIWEQLVLSSLIHERDGRVILLDEPAANLHASAQRTLRDLLGATPGQFLVVTHSQHLLPSRANDVAQVFRLASSGRETQAYHFAPNGIGVAANKLEQELGTSSDVVGLLFASAVVLVEGATEVTAYATWAPEVLVNRDRTLGDMGIALHAVGSKTNFGFFVRYLSTYHIPWAVIVDGDAFTSRLNLWQEIFDMTGLSMPASSVSFDVWKAEAERLGVFTPNTSGKDDFEDIPEVKACLENVKPQGSKVRNAQEVMRAIPCPPSVAEVWRRIFLRRFGVSKTEIAPEIDILRS